MAASLGNAKEHQIIGSNIHSLTRSQRYTSTMVSLPQRMRKLQNRLLAIRLGSGALKLPKDVKRIDLRFAPKMNAGHMGPRYAFLSPSSRRL